MVETELQDLLNSVRLRGCESQKPRTRAEIIAYLGIGSGQYALKRYLDSLVQAGAINMTMPENPRSSKQQFVAAVSAG